MELIRNNIKIEWVDLGEGWNGDWDPDDPDDTSLLRFDVSELKNNEWIEIPDASYCTQFPTNTPDHLKKRALHVIMNKIYDHATTGQSIKRQCQFMSWIKPSDVENHYLEIT
jgi:hypothetical protein